MTESEYDIITRIIEVYDEYLDAEITSDEFEEKLDTLNGRLSSDSDISNTVAIYIRSSIWEASSLNGEISKIEEDRNTLEDLLE